MRNRSSMKSSRLNDIKYEISWKGICTQSLLLLGVLVYLFKKIISTFLFKINENTNKRDIV